jgi:hypothetical protein
MKYLAFLNLIDKKTEQSLPHASDNTVKILLSDTFILIGALAFLMVVVSGLRYILARGSPERVTSAKNSLMYSLIGVIIAALAATIVNIVINNAP